MLKELSIRNFAIIDDLQIGFSDGLTILSGETGAGKSIILNAVNLLLGSRAATDLVRSGADSAELEAFFKIAASSRVANIMTEQGYVPSEGLLVRRIIARNDANRVYLNDRMATIQLLNAISENLASISGQHAHQLLLKEEQHLLILDQFGGLLPLREAVGTCFQKMLTVFMELDGQKNLGAVASKAGLNMSSMREIIAKLIQNGLVEKEDQKITMLDKDFFEYLVAQLSLAVGPIAQVLIEDEVENLGYELSRFPGHRVAELIDKLDQEIRRDEKKNVFLKMMAAKRDTIIKLLRNMNNSG